MAQVEYKPELSDYPLNNRVRYGISNGQVIELFKGDNAILDSLIPLLEANPSFAQGVARGYLVISDYEPIDPEEPQQLPKPTLSIVSFNEKTNKLDIKFNPILHTKGYAVTIEKFTPDIGIVTVETDLSFLLDESGIYRAVIQAKGDGENYLDSDLAASNPVSVEVQDLTPPKKLESPKTVTLIEE